MSTQVAHIWGFYEGDGHPRFPDGVAVSSESAYEALCRLRSHHHHHGGEIDSLRTIRTLDGWLVGVEYDVLASGNTAHMWHRLMSVGNDWPEPAVTEEIA